MKHDGPDMMRYEREALFCIVALYTLIALTALHVTPLWVFMGLAPILYMRSALSVHELFHVRTARQVGVLQWLWLPEGPLNLGYREYRKIHMAHHKHVATSADPEHYLMRHGALASLLLASLSTEHHLLRWLRSEPFDRKLAVGLGARLSILVALAAIDLASVALCLIILRVVSASAQFLFHHVLHVRDGRLATYRLTLPRAAYELGCLVVGRRLMPILCEHPVHHAHPHIAARHFSSPIFGELRHTSKPRA